MYAKECLNRLISKTDDNSDAIALTIISKMLNGISDTEEYVKNRIDELNSRILKENLNKENLEKYRFAINQLKDVLKWLPK